MRRRCLGRTGLEVGVVALGTVELGLDYGITATGDHVRPSEREACELLNRAIDLGVNLIDTARAYGSSEEIIGRCVSHRRSEIVLATKVQTLGNVELTATERATRMLASVEESLRKLTTDCVDLLLLHTSSDADISRPECVEVLERCRSRGMTRFTGASLYGPAAAIQAIELGVFDCLQIAWSALDRRPETDVLRSAVESNVGLVLRSVLMRGALTHRWRALPTALGPVAEGACRLEKLAAASGMDLPELAYRYVLSADGPMAALVGTARLPELEACIRYAEKGPLAPEVLREIRGLETPAELLDLSRWPPV